MKIFKIIGATLLGMVIVALVIVGYLALSAIAWSLAYVACGLVVGLIVTIAVKVWLSRFWDGIVTRWVSFHR